MQEEVGHTQVILALVARARAHCYGYLRYGGETAVRRYCNAIPEARYGNLGGRGRGRGGEDKRQGDGVGEGDGLVAETTGFVGKGSGAWQ